MSRPQGQCGWHPGSLPARPETLFSFYILAKVTVCGLRAPRAQQSRDQTPVVIPLVLITSDHASVLTKALALLHASQTHTRAHSWAGGKGWVSASFIPRTRPPGTAAQLILCLDWTPGLNHEVGVVLISWKTSSVFKVEHLKAYERKRGVVHGFLPWRVAHCYKNPTKIPKHRFLFSPIWWLRMVSWAHSSGMGLVERWFLLHLWDGVQGPMQDTLGFESWVCHTDQCHPGHVIELYEPQFLYL